LLDLLSQQLRMLYHLELRFDSLMSQDDGTWIANYYWNGYDVRLLACFRGQVILFVDPSSSILDSSISIRSGYGTSQISRLGASPFHGSAAILLFWEVGRISKAFGIRPSISDLFQWSVGRRIRGYTRLHQIPGVICVIVYFYYQYFIFFSIMPSDSSMVSLLDV